MKYQAVITTIFLVCALTSARFWRPRPPFRPPSFLPPPPSLSLTSESPASSPTTLPSITGNAASSEDDLYVARAKELIDAGICNRETADTSACGDGKTSYYTEFEYNGRRVIVSSGYPDHPAEKDPIHPVPDIKCEMWIYISLPLEASKGSTKADTPMGTYGLAVTGASWFNELSHDDGRLAVHDELPTLDSCFGHTSPFKAYHYHANINCTDAGAATGANDPSQCLKLGYLNDGVPIYGYCNDASGNRMTSCYKLKPGVAEDEMRHVSGSIFTARYRDDYEFDASIPGCNLDEASGAIHPTTGEYSYFTTDGFPYVPMYYYGSEGQQRLCSLDL